jgi:processive 1,2-diacylglycerol beta-glucosyltransferase
LEKGAAVKINNVATLGYKLDPLLRDRSYLERLKENARKAGKPRAAFIVAQRALAWPSASG